MSLSTNPQLQWSLDRTADGVITFLRGHKGTLRLVSRSDKCIGMRVRRYVRHSKFQW